MGILLAIAILVFAIPNIIDFLKKENKKERTAEERRQQQIFAEQQRESEEQRKKQIKNEYMALVKKYTESDITRRILTHICNGNYEKNFPEEIVVGYDFVRSTLDGSSYSFDFKQNKVARLHSNGSSFWYAEPTVAMAEAINKLMWGRYTIHERNGIAYMEWKALYDF